MDANSPPASHMGSGQPKRRSGAPRVVASLSEEQRRHKREIDRRAQRALRQRAKDCMHNLEQQFARLQETCARQEREIAELREENKKLQQCRDVIRDALANNSGPSTRPEAITQGTPDIRGNTSGRTSSSESGQSSHDPRSSPSAAEPAPYPSVPPESGADSGPPVAAHSYSPLALSNPRAPQISGIEPHAHAPAMHSSYMGNTLPGHQSEFSPITSGSSPPLDGNYDAGLQNSLPTPCSGIVANQWHRTPPKAAYNALPTHLLPSCPLDQILLDFIESRRADFSGDLASETSIWPQKPNVRALIDGSLVQTLDALSSIISRVLSTFQHVKLPEKLAFFYVIYHTSKWFIQPTKENYLSMPTWLRPTVTQVTVTHEIWVDTIPWPGVRDILIESPNDYPFELFSEFYSHNVTVNWPFDDMDAISGDGNSTLLHSIFEKHVQKASNWTVSSEFKSRFPEMISAIHPSH